MAPKPATEEQKKQAMGKAVFDQAIVSNIHRYDDLKTFLLSYGDTIIAYRNSRNYIIDVDAGGKTDTVLQAEACYTFFQGNISDDIENVPAFLKTQLNTIYKAIGVDNIESFEVCKDKEIRIEVRTEDEENGLSISHSLLWNATMEKDYAYEENKDTLLNGNCIYRIGLTEYHGH